MADELGLIVATWNISSGLFKPRDNTVPPDPRMGQHYIENQIRIFDPDIIALQEVDLPPDGESQAARIAKSLDYPHVDEWPLSESHLVPSSRIGIAILSRRPITQTKRIDLPNPNVTNKDGETSHDKGLLAVQIDIDGEFIWFVCGHLLPLHRFEIGLQEQHAARIFNAVESSLRGFLTNPFIAGIDFNANLGEEHLPALYGDGRTRSLVFSPTRPEGTISDQIVCGSEWRSNWVRIQKTKTDHFLCVAEVAMDRKPVSGNPDPSLPGSVRLIHLSDLHFGMRSRGDVEWKTFVDTMDLAPRKERLKTLLGHLSPEPDYLIISGDVTIAGRQDGFDSTAEFIDWMEAKAGLDRSRIIVVPGNHDVRRAAHIMDPVDPVERWDNFHATFNDRCVRPWLPSHDRSQSDVLEALERLLSTRSDETVWGSFLGPEYSHLDPVLDGIQLPFVFDRRRNLLIYAFNSASVSGSQIIVEDSTRDAIAELQKLSGGKRDAADMVIKAYEKEIRVDPARIQPEELDLFHGIVNLLNQYAPNDVLGALKVAVLHHHVVPIPIEEVKKFDIPTNAGRFIQELTEAKFNVVLHGHKHYPEALTTGAALTENPQLVLSGGTIGGGEATGKSAGFYIIDYSTDNKTLHPMFVELQPTGNPKAVVGNAIRHQPVEISADGGIGQPSRVPLALDWESKARASEAALIRYTNQVLRGQETHSGWSHQMDEDRVSTVATAFGLRILSLTGAKSVRAKQVVEKSIKTLLDRRLASCGGWKASSQPVDRGQIEPTAFVILGLRHWIDSTHLANIGSTFEDLLIESDVSNTEEHLFSVALCAVALCRSKPESDLLGELDQQIKDAAFLSGSGRMKYWAARIALDGEHERGTLVTRQSILHTSVAALALNEIFVATDGKHGCSVGDLHACLRWLNYEQKWPNTTEDINRRIDGRDCTLVVKYYTKTWAARALLLSPEFRNGDRVKETVHECSMACANGLWGLERSSATNLGNARCAVSPIKVCDVQCFCLSADTHSIHHSSTEQIRLLRRPVAILINQPHTPHPPGTPPTPPSSAEYHSRKFRATAVRS